jgi:hypothetical protein
MTRVRVATIAAVSSIFLAACGGGSPGSATNGALANAQGVSKAAATASPNGTTIPSAASIVDAAGNTWTVANGVVLVNSANAGFTAAVQLLLYYNGEIYQQNVKQLWWKWQNNTWASTTDPRPATAAAGATTTPTTTTPTTTPATTPTATAAAGSPGGLFYAMNGHINQGGAYARSSQSTQIAQLKDLGVTMYRNDVWDAQGAAVVGQLADAGKTSGVSVYPVLTPSYSSAADETAAYNDGFTLGKSAAAALIGKVNYYEVGNEFGDTVLSCGCDGNQPSNYDNTNFQKARGSIRGMIDGIKSVDTSGKIIINANSWLHTAFDDMLMNGTQPDGTSGHPKVTWDVTAWHWYSDMGDITHAGGGGTNVLQYLKNTYGKPIFLTEVGVRPGMSDAATGSYLVGNTMLGEYQANAANYNIQSVELYELYDDASNGGDGNYGLLTDTGNTPKASYATLKSFIASHPMQ